VEKWKEQHKSIQSVGGEGLMGKSQVEKFKARLSKKEMDKQAINTRAYQKKTEEYEKYGAEGVEELMGKGNIKEAAVVFSQEGMKAFANMFGNSMENAVTNVLNNRMEDFTKGIETKIESIIEAKMLEMLEGMTEGMKLLSTSHPSDTMFKELTNKSLKELHKQLTEDNTQQELHKEEPIVLAEDIKIPVEQAEKLIKGFRDTFPSVDKHLKDIEKAGKDETITIDIPKFDAEKDTTPIKEETKSKDIKLPKPRAKNFTKLIEEGYEGLERQIPRVRLGTSKADVELVTPYIMSIMRKHAGEEVKSSDVVRTLDSEFGIKVTNPTAAWKKIISTNPNIDNVGFGIYKYEEKTFHPTV
jgi:hypothetical protein